MYCQGKAHKPYEVEIKIGVVTTSKESFIVGMKSFPGNPYDEHTLTASLEQVYKLTVIAPKEAYVDQGNQGHAVTDTVKVWMVGIKRGVAIAVKKEAQATQCDETRDRTHEKRWMSGGEAF